MHETTDHRSNTEFISDLMEKSRFGALSQLVIITAIDKYVSAVTANEEETLRQFQGTMFSAPAWIGACKEIKHQLEKRLAI